MSGSFVERKTRFELATLALARRCSTAELLPQYTPLVQAGRLELPRDHSRQILSLVRLPIPPHLPDYEMSEEWWAIRDSNPRPAD